MRKVIFMLCAACVVLSGCSSIYMGGAWPKTIRQRAAELRTAAQMPDAGPCAPLFEEHAKFLDILLTTAGQKTSAEVRAELGGEL